MLVKLMALNAQETKENWEEKINDCVFFREKATNKQKKINAICITK